ncbi:MAG: hypothetical protein ACI4MH_03515 [Candidatus Coproplasma sp.]
MRLYSIIYSPTTTGTAAGEGSVLKPDHDGNCRGDCSVLKLYHDGNNHGRLLGFKALPRRGLPWATAWFCG